jgi:hypothetical protein
MKCSTRWLGSSNRESLNKVTAGTSISSSLKAPRWSPNAPPCSASGKCSDVAGSCRRRRQRRSARMEFAAGTCDGADVQQVDTSIRRLCSAAQCVRGRVRHGTLSFGKRADSATAAEAARCCPGKESGGGMERVTLKVPLPPRIILWLAC